MHGFLTEGRAYIDRLLAQTPDAPPSARAKALTGAGYIGYFLGDRAGALAQLEEGVDVARESGDRWHLAIALNLLGNICLYEGDVARTRALAEEGLAVSREQGNETFTAFSIFLLGFLALLASDLERAEALLEESTAVWRRLGNRQFFANALVRLGEVKLRQGRLDAARAHYAESLACAAEMRFMVTIIRCLYGLAGVWAARGEVGRAARLLGATEAHVKAMQVAMPPSERAAVDRHVAALRAGMGEEAFEAAYTEGGRMSLDETLAFAVEDEAPAG
jgi:tetratricopeptide (TPR) repeat protein